MSHKTITHLFTGPEALGATFNIRPYKISDFIIVIEGDMTLFLAVTANTTGLVCDEM